MDVDHVNTLPMHLPIQRERVGQQSIEADQRIRDLEV